MKILHYLTALLMLCLFAGSSQADDLTKQFVDAQAVFERSLAGDEDATELALDQFDRLIEMAPDNPLFTVYLGSAYTLKARDAMMPWTRLKYLDKGLGIIDKTLRKLAPVHDETLMRGVPVSVETRLVAVSTFLSVPGFLNRLQPAKDLLQDVFTDPVFESSSSIVKARFYLQAANAAKREDEPTKEKAFLQKVLNEMPDAPFALDVEQRLRESAHEQ